MRILIATPLYPPDIAEPAPYIKELASHLRDRHTVTVVLYGRIPEKVEGVELIAIDKRRPLLARLFSYTIALWKVARSADIVYAENGPSVELPAGVIAFFLGKRLVIHTGDSRASERANQKKTLGFVSRFARWQAEAVMGDSPLVKPEILPFEEMPASAISAYEESWSNHMRSLEHTFTHAK